MLSAKKIEMEGSFNFELTSTEIVKDVNGNDVEIPKALGTFNLYDLNEHRDRLLSQIKDVEEKIAIINKIK